MFISDRPVEHFHITQNTAGGGVLKITVGSVIVSVADPDPERGFYEIMLFSKESGDQLTEPRHISCFSEISTAVYRAQQMQKS